MTSVLAFSQQRAYSGIAVGTGDSIPVIKSIAEDDNNFLYFYNTSNQRLYAFDTTAMEIRISSLETITPYDSTVISGGSISFYYEGSELLTVDTTAMRTDIEALQDSVTAINSELDDVIEASEITASLDALYVQDSMKNKNGEIGHFVGSTQYYPDISGSMTMPAYWKLLGSDVKAIPIGSELYVGGGITLADGEEFSMTYYLKDTTVITGARVTLSVQGAYTADNYNGIALYSNSTSGITLIDSTLNGAGDIWKAAAGATIDSTFASGPHTLAPGLYTVSVIYNQSAQTTAPVVIGRSTLITTTQRFNFANDRKLTGRVTSRTAPANIVHSSISGYSYCVQVVLY